MNIENQLMKSINNKKLTIEIIIIFGIGMLVYLLAANFDILEKIVGFAELHEEWELDELITVSIFLMFAMIVFAIRRWQEIEKSKILLLEQNTELKDALEKIDQLEGIIPICASCKKIRNDDGFWEQVEQYVTNHSKAKFSHSMCPECSEEFYGDQEWYQEMKKDKGIK